MQAFLRSELPQPKHGSAAFVIQSREEHRPQRSGAKPTPNFRLGKAWVLHKGERQPYDLELDVGPGFPRKRVSQHLWFGVDPSVSFVQGCAVQSIMSTSYPLLTRPVDKDEVPP